MSRGEDIPQDVWDLALEAFRVFSPLPNAFDAFNTALIIEAIARAIMAERERCANVAVARSDHKRAHCDDACVCDNGYHVAAAIRAGR